MVNPASTVRMVCTPLILAFTFWYAAHEGVFHVVVPLAAWVAYCIIHITLATLVIASRRARVWMTMTDKERRQDIEREVRHY